MDGMQFLIIIYSLQHFKRRNSEGGDVGGNSYKPEGGSNETEMMHVGVKPQRRTRSNYTFVAWSYVSNTNITETNIGLFL